MSYSAELIAVGTELLLGDIANTDAQYLSQGLAALGINVYYHTVVGDNDQRLEEALLLARQRADIIITTGGLGPTYDDMTKQTICRVFGREMELHADILEEIRTFFEQQLHKPMPECNVQQAMLPVNCTVFDNPRGTAPGCGFEENGVHVLMLPGPPHECQYMFDHKAVPYLRKLSQDVLVSHNLNIFGVGESLVQELCAKQINEYRNPTVAPYAKIGECRLRVTAKASSWEAADAMTKPVMQELTEILKDGVYGVDVAGMEEVVLSLLQEQGLTLSVVETCTNGSLTRRMLDLPGGPGSVFAGGLVAPSEAVLTEVLQIPADLLQNKGLVSEEVASLVAENCRKVYHSDLGVAIFGNARPEPDPFGNDMGDAWIALATPETVFTKKLALGKRQERIRNSSATYALDSLRRYLKKMEM